MPAPENNTHRSGVNKCAFDHCAACGRRRGEVRDVSESVCICVSFTEGVCFINCRCRCRCRCLCRCHCRCYCRCHCRCLWCCCHSQPLPLPMLMLMLMPQQPLPPQQPCRARESSKRNIPATHACGYIFFFTFCCFLACARRTSPGLSTGAAYR